MKPLLFAVIAVLVLAGSASAQSLDLWGFNPQTQQNNKYLGNLNRNPFDPNSVNNPYGQYGSKYSPDSIMNPYGTYGSPYSPYSPTNPYSSGNQSPQIYGK
jgi:hypothetical protein